MSHDARGARAQELLSSGWSAFQVEKSRVIAIEFESQDPELAAQVANAIAESYLVLQQTAKQEQARAAGEWLSGEIEKLRKKRRRRRGQGRAVSRQAPICSSAPTTPRCRTSSSATSMPSSPRRARRSPTPKSKARIIREALKRGAADRILRHHQFRADAPAVRAARDAARAACRAIVDAARPASAHQGIARADRRSRAADARRRPSGSRARFENDAKVAARKVEALSARLDQLKRQAASTNEQDVQLRALEREAKSQRDLLESYLAKYREATARDSIGALVAGRAHHFARRRVEHAVLAEEAADRADRGARHVHAVGRLHPDRPVAERALPTPASAYAPVARTFEPAAPVAAPPRRVRRQRAMPPTPPLPRRRPVATLLRSPRPQRRPPPRRRRRGGRGAMSVPGWQAQSAADAGRRRSAIAAAAVSGTPRHGTVAGVPADAIEGLAAALGTAGDSGAGSPWSARGATWARRSPRFRWRARSPSRARWCWSISRSSRPICR